MVVTYRNDEPGQQRLGPCLAELDRGGPVQRLELARLDRGETAAQLVGILGAAPPADLVDAIFVRSEGNPFFTEELLAACGPAGALPPTLRDLLRGRVEALPERSQHLWRRWRWPAGRCLTGCWPAWQAWIDRELADALRVAVAHQLLVIRSGEDGYEFRHALLREVVDADLLPGERARLHAAYAHALTERPELAGVAPAVLAAELAVHWDAAGESAQALSARIQAGVGRRPRPCLCRGPTPLRARLGAVGAGARLGPPAGLDRVDLLSRAAEAAAFTGAVERAVGLVEDALDRVDPAVEPVRAAVLLARLGNHLRFAGDEAGALAVFEQAERLLAGAPARPSAPACSPLTPMHCCPEPSVRGGHAALRGGDHGRPGGRRSSRGSQALRVLAGVSGRPRR